MTINRIETRQDPSRLRAKWDLIRIPPSTERADIHQRLVLGEKVEGITVVERAQTRPFFETSFQYVFPDISDLTTLFNKRTITVGDPKEGDVAFYIASDRIAHVGIIQFDGSVNSKWGLGHVYNHPLFLVPPKYGDGVYCRAINNFRRQR